MKTTLYFLVLLGALGAFDTLYYHEWRLRLPSKPTAASELRLHAVRDFAYTIVFATLAWTTWNGLWVWPLAAILLFEVWATLADFLEEDRTRGLPAGERVMHAIMGIVYGVFLANLYPHAARWAKLHSAFGATDYGAISWILTLYAVGVFTSGLRDLAASRKLARTGERLPA
ncbi:MAG: hypothetical protein LAQ69_00090 [Acidobacteriia bacterium]|nr:hypothetical protein [Terriglobia bacterium]